MSNKTTPTNNSRKKNDVKVYPNGVLRKNGQYAGSLPKNPPHRGAAPTPKLPPASRKGVTVTKTAPLDTSESFQRVQTSVGGKPTLGNKQTTEPSSFTPSTSNVSQLLKDLAEIKNGMEKYQWEHGRSAVKDLMALQKLTNVLVATSADSNYFTQHQPGDAVVVLNEILVHRKGSKKNVELDRIATDNSYIFDLLEKEGHIVHVATVRETADYIAAEDGPDKAVEYLQSFNENDSRVEELINKIAEDYNMW